MRDWEATKTDAIQPITILFQNLAGKLYGHQRKIFGYRMLGCRKFRQPFKNGRLRCRVVHLISDSLHHSNLVICSFWRRISLKANSPFERNFRSFLTGKTPYFSKRFLHFSNPRKSDYNFTDHNPSEIGDAFTQSLILGRTHRFLGIYGYDMYH